MHVSAKRGIAIACRLSVRLSVALVEQDHIRWKSWKLIARTSSPTPSLFVASPKAIHLLPGEHGEILGRLEVGWEKMAFRSTKATISLKRVQIEEKLLWGAHRNCTFALSNGTIPDPLRPPLPNIRGFAPH